MLRQYPQHIDQMKPKSEGGFSPQSPPPPISAPGHCQTSAVKSSTTPLAISSQLLIATHMS